ncbi:pentapeptide repeat-containing protein [Actinomadura sp. 9N407]|uniref:pentapeptide repeat-containing protein n=1 Tax=Actinomadura sp. 9N407 TaxID=3375154 RepID=UPI0037B99611
MRFGMVIGPLAAGVVGYGIGREQGAHLWGGVAVGVGTAVTTVAVPFLLRRAWAHGVVRRATAAEVAALPIKDREELRLQRAQARLQAFSNMGVLLGVMFTAGGLVYTARTLETAQQTQITDRYTKAVEQLGNRESRDARIGAIYALHRLAEDSDRDFVAISQVLSAYVREHIREGARPRSEGSLPNPSADVTAAFWVLGRIGSSEPRPYRGKFVQLYGLDAHNLNMPSLFGSWYGVSGVVLSNADLHGSNLTGAGLDGAVLGGANLRGATLSQAFLRRAGMRKADLRGADLAGAEIDDADLRGADLRGIKGMTPDQIRRTTKTDTTTRF